MVAPLPKDHGVVLGACGLNKIDHASRLANLGYWVVFSLVGADLAVLAAIADEGRDEGVSFPA